MPRRSAKRRCDEEERQSAKPGNVAEMDEMNECMALSGEFWDTMDEYEDWRLSAGKQYTDCDSHTLQNCRNRMDGGSREDQHYVEATAGLPAVESDST